MFYAYNLDRQVRVSSKNQTSHHIKGAESVRSPSKTQSCRALKNNNSESQFSFKMTFKHHYTKLKVPQ